MKIRTRISIAFLLLTGAGFYWLVDWVLDDLRPRYLAAMEEAMVDTAAILATAVEEELDGKEIPPHALSGIMSAAYRRRFNATIYEYTKTSLNVRVYVTDKNGIVIYDSDGGRAEGADYSRWNDVLRTLRGEYGARATHRDPDDPLSAILYVAAPIRYQEEIVGVLTVGKPAASVATFLETAKRDIILAGIIAAAAVISVGFAVSRWVSRPIERLTRYAGAVRDGQRATLPPLGNDEIGRLGTAFEEMRVALAGKQYVEDYVQTLTHQLKSPVAAIRGAVELLDEEMPLADRRRFLGNLHSEAARLQALIDRMLNLASLENREMLRDPEPLDLSALVVALAEQRLGIDESLRIQSSTPGLTVIGERFLLEQAVDNLLQNARDFANPGSRIEVSVTREDGCAVVEIVNEGPEIPAYARERIFERFYSLPRPGTGKKSTGLGLPFVRSVAHLHRGEITLENTSGGVRASLRMPVKP